MFEFLCFCSAMSSEYVVFKKHEVCHRAQKGDKVAQAQLTSLVSICEQLLDQPGKIQDACAHLQSFMTMDSSIEQESWPSAEDIKCFSSIPKDWLWEFLGKQNPKFNREFIKKIEMRQKGVVREIAEFATDLPAGAMVPKAFADQEVASRVLVARCEVLGATC